MLGVVKSMAREWVGRLVVKVVMFLDVVMVVVVVVVSVVVVVVLRVGSQIMFCA